jgi:hypothetical protein
MPQFYPYDPAMRLAVVLVLLLLVPASPAYALQRLHVTITGQDHRPRVGKPWHYEVRVANAAGKPVAARIHLQFMLGPLPVGEVGVHVVKHGFWQETFGTPGNPAFPAAARGQHLVLQATATARGYAKATAGWPLVVQ